jgi:hypothetical protein
MSWLGRSRAGLPRELLRDRVHLFAALAETRSGPPDVSILPETDHICSDEAPSAPDSAAPAMDSASALTIDIAAIAQRYPLLRNAL